MNLNKEEREKRDRNILKLYIMGFSNTDIAKKFNFSRERVRQILNNFGIKNVKQLLVIKT